MAVNSVRHSFLCIIYHYLMVTHMHALCQICEDKQCSLIRVFTFCYADKQWVNKSADNPSFSREQNPREKYLNIYISYSAHKLFYQSPLILTELFQHNLINVSYLTTCYLYQVMMTLHFLNDVANDT